MTPVSSNEPRDQLAEIVNRNYMQCIDARPIRTPWEPIADAVIGAGWRPPPRVLKTDAELATVARGTVVHAKDGTIACRYDAERGVVFGDERPFPWSVLRAPATVLWSPEEPK